MENGDVKELGVILSSFPKDRRQLIRILKAVQEEYGYISEEAMEKIAEYLGMPKVEVYGVATFYNQFRFVPLGKYHIVVCMGTACHSMGGDLVLDAFKRELGIDVEEVTEDLMFSLSRVGCVGCCTKAPVVIVNGEVYAKMTPFKVEELLTKLGFKKE